MVVDYDAVAPDYDRRYALHDYPGIRACLLRAVTGGARRVLELGCGTGRWLSELSLAGCEVAGIEPSRNMLERARHALQGDLRHGVAEALPWPDASFDSVCCVNALHHFTDPQQALREACRVLRPGGTFLSIGLDPHVQRDQWWVYDFFPETWNADLQRFPSAATRIAWLRAAGLAQANVSSAEHLESSRSLSEAREDGILAPTFTSQLTALSSEQYAAGIARIEELAARDPAFRLVSRLTLYATRAQAVT